MARVKKQTNPNARTPQANKKLYNRKGKYEI